MSDFRKWLQYIETKDLKSAIFIFIDSEENFFKKCFDPSYIVTLKKYR